MKAGEGFILRPLKNLFYYYTQFHVFTQPFFPKGNLKFTVRLTLPNCPLR